MYYAVFYATDGTIHLWPNETREGCESKLMEMLEDHKTHSRCKRTTIIHRDDKAVGEDGFIFGSPNSLNILAKFDKKKNKRV